MLSWRRFLPWAVIIAVLGCNRPGPSGPDNSLDPITSQAEAAAAVAHAAAIVGHRHLSDTNRYPSDGSTPAPKPPGPSPAPSDVCDLCDGKNWIGDGQPRNPCPKCNKDGRKPPKGFTFIEASPREPDTLDAARYFPKLDRTLTDIISGETQRDPVIKADILKDGLLEYLNDKDEAAGDAKQAPLPEESPVASLPEASKPPEPEIKTTPEPAPQPVASVVGYRAKADGVMIDQWYKDASSLWESSGWKVQPKIEANFKTPRSYFLVSEPDGTVTRVYEYLNKDSLGRAKSSVSGQPPLQAPLRFKLGLDQNRGVGSNPSPSTSKPLKSAQ